MRLNLGTQLYILIFFVVVIALIINSYFDYRNIKKNYLVQAYVDSKFDMDIIRRNLETESKDLTILLNKISLDENVQNTLNLISNYQDKTNYSNIVFDTEKKNLLNLLEAKINTLGSYSFAIFDKNKDLVVLDRMVNDLGKSKGIVIYDKGERYFFNTEKDQKTEIPYIYDIRKDKVDEVSIKLESNAFSVRLLKSIYIDGKTVGYIRAKRRFSQDNIHTLLQNINNSFSFLVNDVLIGNLNTSNIKYILENADSFEKEIHNYKEMFNDEKYFYHAHYLKSLNDKKLFFISGTDKEILDEKVLSLLVEFNLSVLVSISIAFFLAFLFIRKNILNPLSKLMEGMKDLKDRRYSKIRLKTNNELKDIANEFNQLTDELENSFLKIEEINRFLENIIDSVPVRIFWKDKNGIYLGCNKLFLADTGLKAKRELIGKSDFDLAWPLAESQKTKKDDLEVIENNKESLLLEETKTALNGHVIHLLTSKVPLRNASSEIIGVLGIYEDITKQKRIEKELHDKDLILFEQSKLAAMGEMLENIAHQWRQPLSMITTSATGALLGKEMDMLSDKVLVESLKNITSSAKYLSSTIDDFRDFYKTDNHTQKFDIKNCFDKSQTLLITKFRNKDIKIISDLESILVSGNEGELIQVLMNIFNNAKDALEKIKSKRMIFFTAKLKEDVLILSIKDNAEGIPIEVLPNIFEHKFTTKGAHGTGIGLYMSKLIVQKLKGKLYAKNVDFEYENVKYKGAEFIIEIPVN